MGEKPPKTCLHLRFNCSNSRHMEAAAFIDSVKPRYKNALITAAVEAYREQHPFGIDYPELESIQRQTWQGFRPASPILQNLRARGSEPPPEVPASERRMANSNSVSAKASEAMDKAIDFFNLNNDE